MAKQIESLLVRLGIQGYEELGRLKGAFRGLETTLGQSDAALNKVRQAILDYGKDVQRSEGLLKGMETALKGVREQATLHSPLYTQLTQDIRELSAAQREYIVDLNSTKTAYAELARIEEGAARRAAKVRQIQQLAVEDNPLVVAGRRRTEFGDFPQAGRGPGGVFIAPPFRSTPYSPGTQYDRPIGPQPVSQQVKAAEKSVEQAMQGINDAVERGLNERAKLQEKYRQREYDKLLEGLDLEGQARKRAFDAELADFDRRLDIADRRRSSRRRLTAQGVTQIAGAAISGGIFGGPEGFLGGVVGGAVGGVGGAFAGAAIGAQVSGLRQAAGAAAEYAAAINQQRRALEGVVGDSAAYQQSLAFIDQTSRQLAIPQEQVTRNFTRLSASVLGAGGNVDVAQEAFMGISAGIRATGGTLADLDAALLATSQVFSKGKVSAEELRGQIGERLPGAFTLFAQSIGKTPQEVDKLLEKGEVGLNDFLSFVRLLSTEYGQQALSLAASSEAAGDRLQTAFGRIQEAIGEAFQPVGAEFQEVFSRFVLENEQAIVSLAQTLAGLAKAVLELSKIAVAALTGVGAYLSELNRQVRDVVDTWIARWRALTGFISSAFTGAARAVGVDIAWLSSAFSSVTSAIAQAFGTLFGYISSGWKQTVENMVNASSPIAWIARLGGLNLGKAVAEGISAARGGGGAAQAPAGYTPPPRSDFQFPASTPDAAGSKAAKGRQGPKPPEDRTQELRAEAELFATIAGYENQIRDFLFEGKEIKAAEAQYNKERAQIEYEIARAMEAANYEGEKQAIRTLGTLKLRAAELKFQDDLREGANKRFYTELQNQEAVRNAIAPLKQFQEQQERQLQNAKEYGRLVMEGVLPSEAERIINWQNLVAEQQKSLDTQIKITEEQIAQAELRNQELGSTQVATKELRDRLALLRRQRQAVDKQAEGGPGRGPTETERVQGAINQLQGELNELASISTVIVGSANAIGDAFGNAFQKLITGAASAREALAGFFQDTANAFIKMATEIIAKQITMLILQTALKALGAVAGGGGKSLNLTDVGTYADNPVPFVTSDFSGSAKGNAFTPQGQVQMYAKGGVVNGITPFRFAKGGAMGLGVMGEAGPEAILPLKRTPSGDLGVMQVPYSKGGDLSAMQVPYSKGSAATPSATNETIRFESVVINSQEYVTRDEAERIGQAAASRGADIAQRRIKNNPQVRRSLGMA